jgi:hypothetical protein
LLIGASGCGSGDNTSDPSSTGFMNQAKAI